MPETLGSLSKSSSNSSLPGESSPQHLNMSRNTPESPATSNNNNNNIKTFPKPVEPAKTFPISCEVETLREDGSQDHTQTKTYAILPASTRMCDLLAAALLNIGYTAADAKDAKGMVQFKHWKPLTFDMITDDEDASLGEILGEHVSMATLKIILRRSVMWAVDDVKEKLKDYIRWNSHKILSNTACPISKSLLSRLINGNCNDVSIPEDLLQKFYTWHYEQNMKNRLNGAENNNNHSDVEERKEIERKATKHGYNGKHIEDRMSIGSGSGEERSVGSGSGNGEARSVGNENGNGEARSPTGSNLPPGVITVQPEETRQPHYLGNSLTPRTTSRPRVRTAFDPEHEIPRLCKWFEENPHPTREQMHGYLEELNQLPLRQGPKALDYSNVTHWFKNSRAAKRRAEMSCGSIKALAGHDTSGDSNEELDLSVDSDPSFGASTPPIPPQQPTFVPELPNRNAVYVVNPLFARGYSNDRPVEVVNFGEESMETEDHKAKIHRVPKEEGTEEAQDLSVRRPRKASTDSNSSSEYAKSAGNNNDGHYRSPSPGNKPLGGILSHPHNGPLMPGPMTPLHYDHMRQHHQVLQMAAMSQALNMHGFTYPPSLHAPHAATPPTFNPSLKQASHSLPQAAAGMDSFSSSTSPLAGLPSGDDRKKRSRVFIDPLTEIPKLEKWFLDDTHPSSYMIEKYTEELNRSQYRQRFPRLESKNVQLWFKNHRAKVKRTRLEQNALSNAASASSSPTGGSMFSAAQMNLS